MSEPKLDADPVCADTPDSGSGPQLLHVWYFNVEIAQCRELLYKGFGGTANRFGTRQECEDRCLRHYTEGAERFGPHIKAAVDHKPKTQKTSFSHRFYGMDRRMRYGLSDV